MLLLSQGRKPTLQSQQADVILDIPPVTQTGAELLVFTVLRTQ